MGLSFHYANAQFLTHHLALSGIVGIVGMLAFANIVHESKKRKPQGYGLFVRGIAAGIFLQGIIYFPDACNDACSTSFTLKLGACVILMVDNLAASPGLCQIIN
jgi:hypothetical protein